MPTLTLPPAQQSFWTARPMVCTRQCARAATLGRYPTIPGSAAARPALKQVSQPRVAAGRRRRVACLPLPTGEEHVWVWPGAASCPVYACAAARGCTAPSSAQRKRLRAGKPSVLDCHHPHNTTTAVPCLAPHASFVSCARRDAHHRTRADPSPATTPCTPHPFSPPSI